MALFFRLLATHDFCSASHPCSLCVGNERAGDVSRGVVGSYYQLSQLPAIVCLIVHDPLFLLRRFMMFVLIFLRVDII
jgi:hypothetical protein